MYFILKTLISALVIAAVSEIARRYSVVAAVIASLPLTSILALIWLYHDTQDVAKISALSYGILWLIVPSLIFFIALPMLLQQGVNFYLALLGSVLLMLAGYGIFLAIKATI